MSHMVVSSVLLVPPVTSFLLPVAFKMLVLRVNIQIGLDWMTLLFNHQLQFQLPLSLFSSQLGSFGFERNSSCWWVFHLLHVKSGGHLRDLAAYGTSSSAESSLFSAFTFLAALYHAFIPCPEVDFLTLVENPRGSATSVLPLMWRNGLSRQNWTPWKPAPGWCGGTEWSR